MEKLADNKNLIFKTPALVLEKSKVLYLVEYYQYSFDGNEPSFPSVQRVEFVDSNPLFARRNAFEFARSSETYPHFDPKVKKQKNDILPDKPAVPNNNTTTIRWCNIDCIEYGTSNRMRVFNEFNTCIFAGDLLSLSQEVEMFKRLGFSNNLPVMWLKDEKGFSYEVIGEGFSFTDFKFTN